MSERGKLGDLDVDGGNKQKWILKEQGVEVNIKFM